MARFNNITNSFISGEASQKFMGRSDTQQFNSACESIFNMLVYPQGGAGRRPGTQIIKKLVASDATALANGRMFPFYGSDGSRWQLVITLSLGDTTPYNWQLVNVHTEATEYVKFSTFGTYYDLIALANLQVAQAGDSLFVVQGTKRPFKIVYDSSAATGSKFTMRSFPDIQFPNPSDVGLNGHRQMAYLDPVIGTPTACLKLTVDGSNNAYLEPGTSSTVVFDATWVGRYLKLTEGAVAFVVMVSAFTNSARVELTGIGGTSPGTSTVRTYGSDSDLDNTYEEGAWDDSKGWPRTVCFFESRLVFGGTRTFPDRMWFSEVENINNFDQRGLAQDDGYSDPVVTSDPFSTNLRAEVLNEIRWMYSAKTITVGTNYREFVVQGPSAAKTIGIDNIQSNAETPHGSAYVQAARVENATVFLQRSRKQIRELAYTQEENSFRASNLTIIGEHISQRATNEGHDTIYDEGYFTQLAMQECPNGILWCLVNNGTLCALTREREQQVSAWHRHELKGVELITTVEGEGFANTAFKTRVNSISVIQKPSIFSDGSGGELDELWMLTTRAVGATSGVTGLGGTLYTGTIFIEKMALEWEKRKINDGWSTLSVPYVAPIYMDGAYIASSTREEADPGNNNDYGIIGPLPHGKGAVVAVVVDGRYIGEYTVDGNLKIDISAKLHGVAVWNAIVGFRYNHHIIPVVPEVPAQSGSSKGQLRNIDQVTINFHRTIGGEFGKVSDEDDSSSQMEEIPFSYVSTDDGNPPHIPLFTGEKKVLFPEGYEGRPRIKISSDIPLPMQITHIVSRGVVIE